MILTKHANRGAYLEQWIDQANKYYMNQGLAVINKIPTPWKVLRTYSPYTKQYEISKAFPEQKSTVDFGGTAANCSIWFDVKSTFNKHSFPLANIYGHQQEYLQNVAKQGGKAFLLIHAGMHQKTWLLWIDQLLDFMATETRKSIPFSWLDQHCDEVKSKDGILLDYLPLALTRKGV